MTVTLLSLLKAALPAHDLLQEFDYRLSTYAEDFALTAEELARCWQLLSEFVLDANARDLFVALGEIIYREKALRALWPKEREFWRKLVEYEEDEILQKTMLAHYLANKPANYLSACRSRIRESANAIGKTMGAFMNPPEEPWISLNERFGTVRIAFLHALDRAQEVLDEEQGMQAA